MNAFRWMGSAVLAGAVAFLTAHAEAQAGGSGTGYIPAGSDASKSDSSAGTSGTRSTQGGTGSAAGGTTAAPDTGSSTTSDATQLQGKVQAFDRTNNTLTLSGSDKALKIDSSTRVLKDGSRASIDDIREGDQVRASFSGTGDMLHVQRLDVLSGSSGTGAGAGSGANMGTGSSGAVGGSMDMNRGTAGSGATDTGSGASESTGSSGAAGTGATSGHDETNGASSTSDQSTSTTTKTQKHTEQKSGE